MAPRVSIGLPVYNGREFLREAVDSILAQSFSDFELIICDNASTDGTAEISRLYAASDHRVRYHRNERNVGASRNFNLAFELARGEYFKWAAHDDICRGEFLQRCVEVLDHNPEIVLCFGQEMGIDSRGECLGARPYRVDMSSDRPWRRFRSALGVSRGSPPIFGLIRSEVLRKTALIGNYDASDLVLLAELSLHGKLHQLPDVLLLHREHPFRSTYAHPTRHLATEWFDPSKRGKLLFPAWKVMGKLIQCILRCPLGVASKAACFVQLPWWIRRNWRNLASDMAVAVRRLLSGRSP